MLFLTSPVMCLRESCMRENRTCSLGGGRRPAPHGAPPPARQSRWASCGSVLASRLALAHAAGQQTNSRATSEVPSGAKLYARHCAVCHGSDLKGTGPVPAPYRTPPDLTTLTRRDGGKFPLVYVSNVLKKGATLPAHAPAEMPVWGSEFEATTPGTDQAQIAARIRNLAMYIKSRQEK